jgi:glycosyltransferase involved in cell wall biosynthesis
MDEDNREFMDYHALKGRLAAAEARIRELSTMVGERDRILADIDRTRLWRLCKKWYAVRSLMRRRPSVPRASAPPRPGSVTRRPGAAGEAVLFISHNALRMGAQMVLLHFLRWFKGNTGIPFEILLKRGGPLQPDFEALAPVTVWGEWDEEDELIFLGAEKEPGSVMALLPENAHTRRVSRDLARKGFGLIYSNTLANGLLLASLPGLRCPVITHVHELDWCIRYNLSRIAEAAKTCTSRYIAVSRAVQQGLIETLGIAEDSIEIVYDFIAPHPDSVCPSRMPVRVRAELGIPDDAWVVGASGTTDWRKGADLFAFLARAMYRQRPEKPVHFIWVGGDGDWRAVGSLRHDLEHVGLSDFVHFIGARRNPFDYYNTFDVFAMMSREDPCPLVMLEAAALNKPVVCFEGSGGAPEFVEADCGFIVPYYDLDAMAEKTLALLRSPELRRRMGKAGADRVRARHDISVAGPMLSDIIRRYLR